MKFYVARDYEGNYLVSPTTSSSLLIQQALMVNKKTAVDRLDRYTRYQRGGYISVVTLVELIPLTDVQQKVLDDMKECRLEGTNPVEVITVFSQQIQGGYSGYDITNTEFIEVVKRFTLWIDERRS